jgi:hypothetical protein
MSWHLLFCCDSARRSRREEQDTRGVAVARRNISGNGDFWPAASAVQQHPRAHSMLGPGWQALRVSWRWRWDLTCLCRASMSDVNRGEEGRRRGDGKISGQGELRWQAGAVRSGTVSTRCTGKCIGVRLPGLGRRHAVAKIPGRGTLRRLSWQGGSVFVPCLSWCLASSMRPGSRYSEDISPAGEIFAGSEAG